MKYPYLLFDADNTLFDFDAGNRYAFHRVCQEHHLPESEELFHLYEKFNLELWTAFDHGQVTKDFLVVERFRRYLSALGLSGDPAACNRTHLDALSLNTLLVPHALEICRRLSQTHTLYIVTNAVASVQKSRLEKSAIAPYITDAFISEDAGASKPTAAYFDYVFRQVPGLRRDNCLVIGDSLTSDIAGAVSYGLPCCWYNPRKVPRPGDVNIDYEITDLLQLYPILDD